ncbi:MAG: lysylphosphatidylglycerol synthase domain-containing protein, partial [Candidatus Rokubacteria bacterium]|nr:lysylphosphatidylglycerol synthase domain-containing protein [Candidatus Rokubacteria bacterium]
MTNPEAPPSPLGTRRILAGILGAGLAIVLLLWALRGVHLAEVVRQIRNADPWFLGLGVVLGTLTFPIRLIRWRLLLRSETGGPRPAMPLWHAVAI